MRLVARICLGITIAWWPLDRLIYAKFAETLRPSELFRVIIISSCLAFLLALRYAPFRRVVFWPGSLVLALAMGALGYTGAHLGGLEVPWIYLTLTAFVVPIVLPLIMHERILITILQAAGLTAGLFLFRPEDLGSRYLPVLLSMLVLVMLGYIAFGHYPFQLLRKSFLQSLELARNAAELEGKVAEKTQELRELLNHLERAREEERAHISRELHDELGQELTALRYALGLTMERFRRDPGAIGNNLTELDHLVQRTTKTAREIVGQLRPLVLDDLGLKAATEWLGQRVATRAGLACQMQISGDDAGLSAELANTAFRIIQESLTNVMRHAQAGCVQVRLAITDRQLEIRVHDDGVGFSPQLRTSGMGILGMRERAFAMGAKLSLLSSPGAGTEVACTLPRPPSEQP